MQSFSKFLSCDSLMMIDGVHTKSIDQSSFGLGSTSGVADHRQQHGLSGISSAAPRDSIALA